MADFENPFDTTIPDPLDPEGMPIEDALHGFSATMHLLSTPPMPLGNSRGEY